MHLVGLLRKFCPLNFGKVAGMKSITMIFEKADRLSNSWVFKRHTDALLANTDINLVFL